MRRVGLPNVLAAGAMALLGGCRVAGDGASPAATAAPRATGPAVTASAATAALDHVRPWQDEALGLALPVPTGARLVAGFPAGYFGTPWKAFAGEDEPGRAVIAVVLPGSNTISSAQLRVGVSEDARAIARCTLPPQGLLRGAVRTLEHEGIAFTQFNAADAAMNHSLSVQAYRTVWRRRCYAIDLWLAQVNPQVYDPPAKSPFTQAQAEQSLQALWQHLQWLDGPAQR